MQYFKTFISQLKKQLNGSSLPGQNAQLAMAPITRLEELKRTQSDRLPKQSAVLVLFYPADSETKLVFIKRPVDDTIHSGQIAFPGGRVEPDDRDIIHTALREANEEVNIDPSEVTVLGALSKLHIPPSNFDVYPIVGHTIRRPQLNGNYEVDKILEIGLNELLHPETKTTKTIHHRLGKLVDVPCYYVEGEVIWGATAMMVSELIQLIRAIK
jgi:8-oxo-dGTP pyrophosphatase MutT (NUDIX family)